jgi:hypothetical protein
MNDFYTYAYLREERTPYYIGKGKGDRIYRKRGRIFPPPKDKSRIIFLKQNLTEQEAFKHERYMISVFGRIDLGTGILRNRTDGGEGVSNPSEKTRKKMSESHKGQISWNKGRKGVQTYSEETKIKMSKSAKNKIFTEEHKKNLSEANKGKTHSDETKKRISRAKKGVKWWNDGYGNTKFSLECPGNSWVLGRKQIEANRGKKWWNDGCGNCKMSIECPGDNWVLGMK